jgi:hypothetical protein
MSQNINLEKIIKIRAEQKGELSSGNLEDRNYLTGSYWSELRREAPEADEICQFQEKRKAKANVKILQVHKLVYALNNASVEKGQL